MSYFDDASLVMIPSGYKDQKVYSVKPLDGSGDLTFTRASNATRVGPDGLIEKVRTNLILQSNTFSNAAWTKTRSSIVANSVANPIDGTVNASTLLDTIDNATHLAFQSFTATANPYTFSVYVKANGVNWIQMRVDNGSALQFVYFNLSTGAIGTQNNAVGKITSLGNGWYRCSTTATGTAASFFAVVQLAEADNDNSFAGTGTNGVYLYASQLELGDIATAYIATTSAAVSVGPVSGLPRLDYLNSTCPRLLLEPQRSSLVLYSEQMDNASWIKLNGAVTANAAVSPDGYTNADKFVPNTTSGVHVLRSNLFNQSATAAHSWFVKADGYSKIAVRESELVGNYASFNLSTGAVISTNQTASIVNYGNGWYRCTLVDTTTGLNAQTSIVVLPDSYTTGDPLINWSGDGTKGVLAYGAMVELGAYATSYIPTLGTSVTRVADVCSKSGISSLIGQANGTAQITFVMDSDTSADSTTMLGIHASTSTTNRIQLLSRFGEVRLLVIANNSIVTNALLYDAAPNEVVNVAFKYGSAGVTAYVNGTQVYTTASAVVFTETMGLFTIGNRSGIDEFGKGQRVSQALVFPTALSNSDLAALTA